MNSFRIIFRYGTNPSDTNTIDIGLINEITNSYSISSTNSALPSQPAQNSFAMDYGVTRTYRFSFKRIFHHESNDPETDDDITKSSLKWSNGFWLYVMKRYIVNRWQAETDGCKIQYFNYDEEGRNREFLYPSIQPTNVYVTDFRPSQTAGDVNTISGSIAFIVGATNIGKVVAKHTIIDDANYRAYTSDADDDDTNYVTVTNQTMTTAIGLPVNWQIRASSEYDIHDVKFRWCIDQYPTESSTYYNTGDQIVLEDESADPPINIETITLYAIYDADNPPQPRA